MNRRTTVTGLGTTLLAASTARSAEASRSNKPVLVFDVTETLLDLAVLAPVFSRIFGDEAVLRTWFDQLIVCAEALTLTGHYADAGAVGLATLDMLADVRKVSLSIDDVAAFKQAAAAMPAYPDVAPGLQQLREDGFRLVTLSNSPLAALQAQLDRAGLAGAFEQSFSVDTVVQRFKPALQTYAAVSEALGVPPSSLWLVSCHAFDVMGAASAGLHTAMVLRPGNAPFRLGPQPDLVVADIPALARALAERGI